MQIQPDNAGKPAVAPMSVKPSATQIRRPYIFECSACECVEHRGVPFMPAGWTFHEIDGADLALCTDCSPDPADEIQIETIAPEWQRQLELQSDTADLRETIERGRPFVLLCIVAGISISIVAQISKLIETALA